MMPWILLILFSASSAFSASKKIPEPFDLLSQQDFEGAFSLEAPPSLVPSFLIMGWGKEGDVAIYDCTSNLDETGTDHCNVTAENLLTKKTVTVFSGKPKGPAEVWKTYNKDITSKLKQLGLDSRGKAKLEHFPLRTAAGTYNIEWNLNVIQIPNAGKAISKAELFLTSDSKRVKKLAENQFNGISCWYSCTDEVQILGYVRHPKQANTVLVLWASRYYSEGTIEYLVDHIGLDVSTLPKTDP